MNVETDEELKNLAQQVQQDLNKIFKLAEIKELHLDLFQNLTKRLSAFPDSDGETQAIEGLGQQMVGGTLGGPGPGNLMPIEGDDSGTSIMPLPEGEIQATEKTRQSRAGIKIVYYPLPDRPERAWIDPGAQAILFNTENPGFKCAKALNDINFYLIDECLNIVCEKIEDDVDRKKTINTLLNAYLKTKSGGNQNAS